MPTRATCMYVCAILLGGCASHQIAPNSASHRPVTKPPSPDLPLQHANAPTASAITARDLMTRLYSFADDSMMGRQPGTAGYRKATSYIAAEFSRAGLVAVGDNGSYFQAVPAVRIGIVEDVSFGVDSHELVQNTDFLLQATSGVVPVLDGARTVYSGSATDTARWISDEESEGKIVLLNVLPAFDGKRRLIPLLPLLQKFPRAAAIGIAELDLATPAVISAFRRARMVLDTSGAPPAPYLLLLSPRAADTLFGGSLERAQPGTLGRAARARVSIFRTPVEVRNVVAVLPGSDPALRGEYVGVGAHNDHLGMAAEPVDHDSIRAYNGALKAQGRGPAYGVPRVLEQPDSGIRLNLDSLRKLRRVRLDSVYNGADDDGTGTVALLELAQEMAFAKQRPRRSILFISHTAEETGLLGSRWYTDHPTVPRDSIVAFLNMDLFGRGGVADVAGGGPTYLQVVGTRRLSTELGDLIDLVNAEKYHRLSLDYSWDAPGHYSRKYCRSDHVSYARFGIPVVFFSSGYHIDYHQVTDEPQYIDYDHLERITRFTRDVVYRVADLRHRIVVDKPTPDPRAPCVQ